MFQLAYCSLFDRHALRDPEFKKAAIIFGRYLTIIFTKHLLNTTK